VQKRKIQNIDKQKIFVSLEFDFFRVQFNGIKSKIKENVLKSATKILLRYGLKMEKVCDSFLMTS